MDDKSKILNFSTNGLPDTLKIPGIKNGRIEYCTVGPVPIFNIIPVLQQLAEQYWQVEHLAFSGMIAMQQKIALQQPAAVPSYVIIGIKLFAEGEEFVLPKINLEAGK